jgi:hypothetical protein
MAGKAIVPLYMRKEGETIIAGEITLEIESDGKGTFTGEIVPEIGKELIFVANIGLLNGMSLGIVTTPATPVENN